MNRKKCGLRACFLTLVLAAVMTAENGTAFAAETTAAAGSTAADTTAADAGDAASASETAAAGNETTAAGSETAGTQAAEITPPEISGLTFDHAMELDSASQFAVFYYKDGYKLIDIPQSGEYLIVPEGGQVPDGLSDDITVIQQPLDQIYLAATNSMSFFDKLGCIDAVTMTGTDESGWAIDAPIEALENGTMQYAGKYSEPDYEMIVGNGCDLAIESTMILHTPEVQEMLEDLGIPVLIDRCSYETSALGRVEWVKVYGALMNKEDEAEKIYEAQKEVVDSMQDFENTGKTVVFFSINSDRSVVVRKSDDIIPNMIEIAGGKYIFEDLQNPGSSSASVNLSMEEFYKTAVSADYIVYNGTIETPLSSVQDLISKDDLFADFKAVKDGNVWQVDNSWYQSTAEVGYLVADFHTMLTGGDASDCHFLMKVDS